MTEKTELTIVGEEIDELKPGYITPLFPPCLPR